VWGFLPYENVGRYLVKVLDRLGFAASFKLVSPGQFFARAADSTSGVQAGAFYWLTDYPAPSAMLAVQFSCASFKPRSSANTNFSEFCDRGVDRQMRRAASIGATDPAKASVLWSAVDRRLVDRAPVVPLASLHGTDFGSRRLANYIHHPIYGVLLDQAWVR
jgi:peptide/nickel transport system substrate-binding protein